MCIQTRPGASAQSLLLKRLKDCLTHRPLPPRHPHFLDCLLPISCNQFTLHSHSLPSTLSFLSLSLFFSFSFSSFSCNQFTLNFPFLPSAFNSLLVLFLSPLFFFLLLSVHTTFAFSFFLYFLFFSFFSFSFPFSFFLCSVIRLYFPL